MKQLNEIEVHKINPFNKPFMNKKIPKTWGKGPIKINDIEKDCIRCKNKFKFNSFIEGDDVCRSCDAMNCITYWYPRLSRLKFPQPKTIILHTNEPLELLTEGATTKGIDKFIRDLRFSTVEVGTFPVFLRTGYLSNKHDWKNSCFLDKETLKDFEKVKAHVTNIVEMSCIATVDRITPIDFWAIREFIETEPYFTYFSGEMPITKERRYFVRNGTIECHHNYWDRAAFGNNIDDELFLKMAELSKKDEEELNRMALYVASSFSGFWSVDFLKGKNGQWYLTDMAIGESSYHQKHRKAI